MLLKIKLAAIVFIIGGIAIGSPIEEAYNNYAEEVVVEEADYYNSKTDVLEAAYNQLEDQISRIKNGGELYG